MSASFVILVLFGLPIAATGFFIFSLVYYIFSKVKYKKSPNPISKDHSKIPLVLLIISSPVFLIGVFYTVLIIDLLNNPIALM